MCYLKIPKDYLVRQYKDTAFGYGGSFQPNTDHYVFGLPGAEYEGYTFIVTDNFGRFERVQASGNWYSVYVSSDNLPITVKRTENREDGKRYKQYKLTPKDLAAMYGDGFRYAVAHLTEYLNNNRSDASTVINKVYTVGIVDGCWFITDECSERRRIGSKGVDILGYIGKTDVDAVRKLLAEHEKRHRELFNALCSFDRKYNEINREIRVTDELLTEFPYFEQINELKRKALDELENKQNAQRHEVDREIEEFFQKLESFLASDERRIKKKLSA